MKRFVAIFLIVCLFLFGCGAESDEFVVEVQHAAMAPAITETVTVPTSEAVTAPVTEALTEPTTVPTTEPATEPTTEATTEPTELPTETQEEEVEAPSSGAQDYVLNKNSKKFHYPSCGSVKQMKEKNRLDFSGTREEVLAKGYVPCKNCKP